MKPISVLGFASTALDDQVNKPLKVLNKENIVINAIFVVENKIGFKFDDFLTLIGKFLSGYELDRFGKLIQSKFMSTYSVLFKFGA